MQTECNMGIKESVSCPLDGFDRKHKRIENGDRN